jgi:hypothetical protein
VGGDELTLQFRRQGEGVSSLQEVSGQIDSPKARKSAHEKLLAQLQVVNQKVGSDDARMALAREDLASLREMHASVVKRLQQLVDARAARPR